MGSPWDLSRGWKRFLVFDVGGDGAGWESVWWTEGGKVQKADFS